MIMYYNKIYFFKEGGKNMNNENKKVMNEKGMKIKEGTYMDVKTFTWINQVLEEANLSGINLERALPQLIKEWERRKKDALKKNPYAVDVVDYRQVIAKIGTRYNWGAPLYVVTTDRDGARHLKPVVYIRGTGQTLYCLKSDLTSYKDNLTFTSIQIADDMSLDESKGKQKVLKPSK